MLPCDDQVTEAIPRIMTLKRKTDEAGTGTLGMLPRLETFNTPQALPQLNALLFDPDPRIRQQVILSLRNSRLADRSSIPYLMVALHDPNPVIQGAADVTLGAQVDHRVQEAAELGIVGHGAR